MSAFLVLKTGSMGSCKTLSAVSELAAEVRGWGSNEDKRRPVYVHGVRGLTLSHQALPIYPRTGKPGDPVERDPDTGQPAQGVCLVDWDSVERGSVILIDEAHNLFPPRPQGSAVPPHVAWFAMARQLGCTVTLITQDPVSLDIEVRKRCALHQHYTARHFGLIGVQEWQGRVSTDLKRATTVRVIRRESFKSSFALYKSAQVFAPGKSARVPLWVVVPVVAILGGIVVVPLAVKTLGSAMGGHGVSSVVHPRPASGPPPAAPPAVTFSPSAGAAVAASVAPAASSVAGCMVMRSECRCIDSEGARVSMPHAECVRNAREYGYAIPYPVHAEVVVAGVGGAVSSGSALGADPSAVVAKSLRDLGVQR